MNNVSRTASKNWLSLVLIFLFTFSVSLVGARFVRSILVGKSAAETQDIANEPSGQATPPILPDAVALQPIINSWVSNTNYPLSILIYDLDREEVAAEYNSTTTLSASGVSDLMLAYDGYRQLDLGIETPNGELTIDGLTYSDCLDAMVRTGNSNCTESILSDPVRSERITNFISSLEMSQTSDFGQISTAHDLDLLLRHIWQHSDLSLASWANLQDSMLEQATVDDNVWRQGLPSGFSTARVYSKASGTTDMSGNWAIYSDLALVDFVKHNRHFAISILSENLPDAGDLSRLGTLIEGKVIETYAE